MNNDWARICEQMHDYMNKVLHWNNDPNIRKHTTKHVGFNVDEPVSRLERFIRGKERRSLAERRS